MRGLSKARKSKISLSEIKRKTKKRDGKLPVNIVSFTNSLSLNV